MAESNVGLRSRFLLYFKKRKVKRMEKTVKYERHEQVGILTINRPEKGNSLNSFVFNELASQIEEMLSQ